MRSVRCPSFEPAGELSVQSYPENIFLPYQSGNERVAADREHLTEKEKRYEKSCELQVEAD